MAEVMWGSTKMIKNMDSGHFHGQMAENIKDIGRKESSMAEASITLQTANSKLENGRKAKKSNGSIKRSMKP